MLQNRFRAGTTSTFLAVTKLLIKAGWWVTIGLHSGNLANTENQELTFSWHERASATWMNIVEDGAAPNLRKCPIWAAGADVHFMNSVFRDRQFQHNYVSVTGCEFIINTNFNKNLIALELTTETE